ncbi:hypothetical protein GCM10023225_05390 [Kineococcus glutinatus]|uniref:Uncharacterized protein n=1 Tax=Kineococcus glutinatus TaxID=1070872 RepID=A0ABP9H9X4_9ACTN
MPVVALFGLNLSVSRCSAGMPVILAGEATPVTEHEFPAGVVAATPPPCRRSPRDPVVTPATAALASGFSSPGASGR